MLESRLPRRYVPLRVRDENDVPLYLRGTSTERALRYCALRGGRTEELPDAEREVFDHGGEGPEVPARRPCP